MREWVDGWMGGWVDGWMGGWEEAGTVLFLLLGFDPGNENLFSAEQSSILPLNIVTDSEKALSRHFQYLENPEIMLTEFYISELSEILYIDV